MIRRDILNDPPPADPMSERALVAAAIVDPRVFDTVTDITADTFTDHALGQLFDKLAILREAGFPIHDIAATVPELKRLGLNGDTAGAPFLARLIGEGMPAHAAFYAKQLRRCATLRRLRDIAAELATKAAQRDAEPSDVVRWLDSQLQSSGQRPADASKSIGTIAGELLAELRTSHPADRAVFTGLKTHDETAGGWMPGELIVLAARPSVGKTSLALQIAIHNATKGRPATFVSLEMQDRELISRVLCNRGRVNGRRLRTGALEPFHVAALERAAQSVGDLPLRIWSPSSARLSQIRGIARRDHAAYGLSILVIDYLQLIRATDTKRPRHEQVAELSRELKSTAKELGIPILALSQLNRESDGAQPRLANLRESGTIEQDADVVLFLHPDNGKMQLIIAKHRHGEVGCVPLQWSGDHLALEDQPPQNRVSEFDQWNRT